MSLPGLAASITTRARLLLAYAASETRIIEILRAEGHPEPDIWATLDSAKLRQGNVI